MSSNTQMYHQNIYLLTGNSRIKNDQDAIYWNEITYVTDLLYCIIKTKVLHKYGVTILISNKKIWKNKENGARYKW